MLSDAVNLRREEFKTELRRKQKESIFKQTRRRLIGTSTTPSRPLLDPIVCLRNSTQIDESLQEISRRINGSNCFSEIMRVIDEGIVPLLFNFLQDGMHVQGALSVISVIMSKENVHISRRFFDVGLIEYLLRYIVVKDLSHICVNIIGNLSMQSEDYSELMMLNGVHQIMMDQFVALSHQNPSQKGNLYFQFTLWTFNSFVSIKESTIDLAQQQLQILQFTIGLIRNKTRVVNCMEIIYELIGKHRKVISEQCVGLLNQLLMQACFDTDYLWNLLHVMLRLGPNQFNYEQVFKLALMKSKYFEVSLCIMNGILEMPKLHNCIPRDEVWWQKAIIISNAESIPILLKAVQRLEMHQEWIWRLVYEALQLPSNTRAHACALLFAYKRIKQYRHQDHLPVVFEKYRLKPKLEQLAIGDINIHEHPAHLLTMLYDTQTN